jgi:hypothetical protein
VPRAIQNPAILISLLRGGNWKSINGGMGRLIRRFSRSTPHKTYTDGGEVAIVGIVIHAIQSVKYHSQR